MQNLKVTIIQSDLFWEDTHGNLAKFDNHINSMDEPTDLIVLPEVFNTGFPVDPYKFAETLDGSTMNWLKEKAIEKNCTITGSLLIKNKGSFYNMLIWMSPNGHYSNYAKRHVFHLGDEAENIKPGSESITPSLKAWNIRPLICYDLRFPIWSKNTYQNNRFEYDLLIYVANWPAARNYPWKQLLIARAIENQAFVIGVNRIGIDGLDNKYSGDTMVIDPKGRIISDVESDVESVQTFELSYTTLKNFRDKFNVGPDWDQFTIQ
ncbi:MAG: nitrilase family protein [Bacteroidetes bacterium]|nr:nitrilase family protein [Bacteroidota bacterium]